MPKDVLISDLSPYKEMALGEVAEAGFSILGGNSPRIWSTPGTLQKKEGEFGDQVAPWRHLELVARGPFPVINHQPRVGLE